MRQKYLPGAFAVLLTIALGSFSLSFTQNRRTAPKPAASSLMAVLPASDAVALVKMKRALDDALPKLMSGNPAKLAEAMSQIEQFKTRTGIDPRALDELALGTRYSYPREGVTKFNTVAVASGTFSAGAIVAAGRIAANGKYQEQKYQGKTVYIFTLDQQMKLFGLNVKLVELAIAPLDAQTLALGDLKSVREVIDLKRGRVTANADLIALASQDPNAIVGFGGNISPELRRNLSIPNDAIARDLTAVRQVYGSAGLTEKNLEMMAAARTVDEYAARNLGNTIETLKQFGALLINRLPATKAALARSALSSMKITNQGKDLQIRTAVAQTEIAPWVGGF